MIGTDKMFNFKYRIIDYVPNKYKTTVEALFDKFIREEYFFDKAKLQKAITKALNSKSYETTVETEVHIDLGDHIDSVDITDDILQELEAE